MKNEGEEKARGSIPAPSLFSPSSILFPNHHKVTVPSPARTLCAYVHIPSHGCLLLLSGPWPQKRLGMQVLVSLDSLTLTSLARLLQSPETTRLLYDDPYRSQYSTNGQTPQRQYYQPDPETQRREREALEGICHSMSEYATYHWWCSANALADSFF